MYMEKIALVFTKEPKTLHLLEQVLPVVFICFFFDVIQSQK